MATRRYTARMRRADRLFLLINALRGRRRAVSARTLATQLGVSLRTVYRDVAVLQVSGIPIEGEAGVGYVLRKGADIPPLMFDADEIEAVVVGIRFARAFAGDRLAASAARALLKIESVVPDSIRERGERAAIIARGWRGENTAHFGALLDRLNSAIGARHVLRLDYNDATQSSTTRDIEPLCIVFWGGSWTLGGWCRLRADFRQFALARIASFNETGEVFAADADRDLAAMLHAKGSLVDTRRPDDAVPDPAVVAAARAVRPSVTRRDDSARASPAAT